RSPSGGSHAAVRSRARAGPRRGSSRSGLSRRGDDLGEVHGADTGAALREAAADLEQARTVERGADVGARLLDARALVGEHRARRLGVLDREGAAEAAALVRPRKLGYLQPAYVPKQPQRCVADTGDTERVAGRVVRDTVRERRSDVLDAEPGDDELRQFEDVLDAVELADRPDARRRRRDH